MKSIYRTAFLLIVAISSVNLSAQSNSKYSTHKEDLKLSFSKSTPEACRILVEKYGKQNADLVFSNLKMLMSEGKIVLTQQQYDIEYKRFDRKNFSSSHEKLKALKKYKSEVIDRYIVAEEFEIKRN